VRWGLSDSVGPKGSDSGRNYFGVKESQEEERRDDENRTKPYLPQSNRMNSLRTLSTKWQIFLTGFGQSEGEIRGVSKNPPK